MPIKNPTKPIAKIPIAEILEIIKNSCFVGFFRTVQTLLHWAKNDFSFSMIFLRLKRLKNYSPIKLMPNSVPNDVLSFVLYSELLPII